MSETNNEDELISQFCSITGVSPDRGRLYLESAAWNIDLATSSFYEEVDENLEELNELIATTGGPKVKEEPKRDEEKESDDDEEYFEKMSADDEPMSSSSSSSRKKESKKSGGSSNLKTLSDLRESAGSSEDEGQAFYAGGSDHSGQQVLGPKKKNTSDIVGDMFKSAKEHGAQVVDPSEMSKRKEKNVKVFKGKGQKLGTEPGSFNTPSHHLPDEMEPNHPESVEMCLKLWKNGFSIDDGPIRHYDDPSNEDFLASIKRSEVPRELITLAKGGEVNLSMEDHRNEEYKPPKRKLKLFEGEGRRLGSVAPEVMSSPSDNDQTQLDEAAKRQLKVDESQASTTIQVRLTDGTRLVIKCNLSHTVNNIREYICTARPSYGARVFSLLTTFPNKELTDGSATVKDANLQNAVIVLKLQ